MVAHLSTLLLVVAVMVRDITWLRLCVLASALVGLALNVIWLKNPAGAFWQILLLAACLYQLGITWRRDHLAKFGPHEEAFVDRRLSRLSAGHARQLLDMGRWETLKPGAVLTVEGERPEFLTYLGRGQVTVQVDGHPVADVTPGHYVGEMSLIGDGAASATAVVSDKAWVWRIEWEKLERLRLTRPNMTAALEAGIARDMRDKILRANVDGKRESEAAE